MPEDTTIARILTVGPYDMYSFGDQLTLLVTQQYLQEAQVVWTTPFGADRTMDLGRKLQPYGALLGTQQFDAIWTSGGEVGANGVNLEFAFRRSFSAKNYWQLKNARPTERTRILRDAAGHDGTLKCWSPYIPSTSAFPPNTNTMTIVNSAGISHILDDISRKDERISALRKKNIVSVRDKQSSDLLSAAGVRHRLVPDAVHAISHVRPARRDPGSNMAILQIHDNRLPLLGPENVAASIASSEILRTFHLRLMPVAMFEGEDTLLTCYKRLVRHLRSLNSNIDVEILDQRQPFHLVDQIKDARLVIGDSTHLRIVAAAYNIARVSLELEKTTRYAQYWDPEMPYDVRLSGLDNAVADALATANKANVLKYSSDLSRRAHDNLQDLAANVMKEAGQKHFIRGGSSATQANSSS